MEQWKRNLNLLWFSQVLSMMSFGFGLPFLPYYIQQIGITDPTEINIYSGILSMAPAITMAFTAPIWGWAADRWGRKLMIIRAMAAAVLIIGAMGLAQNVWQLIILRAIQGIFTGTVTASAAFVAANTPENKMSYALGFLSSSNFVGYSIGPAMGGWFAEEMGYRFSFFIGSLIMLIGTILVWLFLNENKHSYGVKNKIPKGEKQKPLLTIVILQLLFMYFTMRVVRSVFMPYLPLYVQTVIGGEKGAASITGYINGAVGLATALAGVTLSRLGDAKSKSVIILKLSVWGLAGGIIVNMTQGLWTFAGILSLMFYVLGGLEPIVTSMMAEITPPEKRGALFGIQGLVGSVGWIIAPAMGAIIAIKHSYHAILWSLPVFMIILIMSGMQLKRIEHSAAKYVAK